MSESESEPKYYENITNSNLLLPDRSNIKFTSVNSNLGSNLSKTEDEPMVKQFTDGCYLMNRLGVSDREFNKGNCLLVKGNLDSNELLFNLYYPSGWILNKYFNAVSTTLTIEYNRSIDSPKEIKRNEYSTSNYTTNGQNLYYMRFIFTDGDNKPRYSLFELEEGFGNLCYDACGNSIISIKSSNISRKTDNNKYITNDLISSTSIQKSKLIKNNYLNMVGYNIAHNIFSSESYSSNNRFYSIHSLYVPESSEDTTTVLGFKDNTTNYIITYSQDFKNKNLETYVLYYGNIVYDDKSYFAKTKYSKFSASCIHFHIDNIQVCDGTTSITGVTFTYKLTIFYLDSYNSSTKIELEEYSKFGSIDFIYELSDKSNIITGIMLEIIPDTTEKTISSDKFSIKLENPNLNVWDFNEIGTKFVDKEEVKLYIPRKVEA